MEWIPSARLARAILSIARGFDQKTVAEVACESSTATPSIRLILIFFKICYLCEMVNACTLDGKI